MGAGSLITFLSLRQRLKIVKLTDRVTEELNHKLKQTNSELKVENQLLKVDNQLLNQQQKTLTEQNKEALDNLNKLKLNIAAIEQESIEAGKIFYEQNMSIVRNKLEEDSKKEQLKYEEAKKEFMQEFLILMQENANAFKFENAEQNKECLQLQQQIDELQSSVNAAVAAAKRAEEIKTKTDFYKLQLSATDIEEIKMMRNIAPCLRDQEPLNKVIWKVYYEKPTTDLIGRVIGSGVHSGIYKITNLENQKCYVGQAVNLADRWKQHIKRGVGADAPTRNKLYPAMMAIGVENFSFEVIEECDREQLDAREDYWQEYFKAKEFGYSIK